MAASKTGPTKLSVTDFVAATAGKTKTHGLRAADDIEATRLFWPHENESGFRNYRDR